MPRVRIATNKQDGSLWAEQPNGELIPITTEQADIIRNDPGVVDNFLSSAGGTAQQLLLGAGQLLPGDEDYTQRIEAARQEQQAREMVSPWAAGLGQAAPYMAAGYGAGTLGAAAGGTAGMVGATLGTEAVLGATTTPEAPIQGAAIGAGLAAAGLGAAAGVSALSRRMSSRVLQNVDRATAASPQIDDMAEFVAQAERQGLRVPLSVKQQSDALQDISLGLQSNPITAPLVNRAKNHNAAVLQARANEAIGLDPNRVLTPQVMREASEATASEFKRLARSQGPVMSKKEVVEAISDEIGESFVGKQKFLKQVNRLLKDFKSDDLTTDNLMRFQSSLGDLGRKPSAKGELGIEIGKARDVIIDSIPANAGDEAAFKVAREQWAAQRAVEDALGVRGELSAKKLAKRILAREGDSPIANLGRTAEAMKFMSESKYGTENAVRGGLTGMLLPPLGLGGIGYGIYNQ